MKLLGTRVMPIRSLVLADDIAERQKQTHVIRLADSIKKIGLLHPPTVRLTDNRVLCGHDRIAACILAGRDQVLCNMAECSDEEIPRLEMMENYYRRHDEAGQRAAIIAAVDNLTIKYETEGLERTGKSGRPKTPHGKAVEEVAAARNITKDAVRKTLQSDIKPEKVIETYGMDLSEEFRAEIIIIQRYTWEAQKRITYAISCLTKLRTSNTSVPGGPLDRLKDSLSANLRALKNLMPYSICPWCKGIDPYQSECPGCLSAGWVSKETAARAPAELLDPVNLAVSTKGVIELLEPVNTEEIGGLF